MRALANRGTVEGGLAEPFFHILGDFWEGDSAQYILPLEQYGRAVSCIVSLSGCMHVRH